MAWLLPKDVAIDQRTRDNFLKAGIVRCTTAGFLYNATDLAGEHVNGHHATDVKHHRNSTHGPRRPHKFLAFACETTGTQAHQVQYASTCYICSVASSYGGRC